MLSIVLFSAIVVNLNVSKRLPNIHGRPVPI